VAGTWNEPISRQTQPTRQTTLYVPLPVFVVFPAVEICRRTSNSSSCCRNLLNYVERRRKLLMLWRKARNTRKLSDDGSLTKDRLAQRRGKKPATKAGQLRALWTEIRAAIAEGQSLATIHHWLEEEAGIVVTVQSLGSYLTRMRRKERATPAATTPPRVPAPSKPPVLGPRTKALVKIKKARRFEYPPGPPDESKLI